MLEISSDLKEIINVIKNNKCTCLLAPTFVIDFKYPEIILDIRKVGFEKVVELTYAAKIISSEYHELIKKDPNKQRICANCPSIVKYIENKHPEHIDKLTNIASPMVLMGRFCKEYFGKEYKTIFIGPCFTKKIECRENPEDVDYALTFKEFQEIYFYLKANNELEKIDDKNKKNFNFDKFYNDFTKIYPISGAVAQTMHYKGILKEDQVICCEQINNIEKALEEMKNNQNIKFLDILFCEGGCCGGPGIISDKDIFIKIEQVKSYREISKDHTIGKNKGLLEYAEKINLDVRRDKSRKLD